MLRSVAIIAVAVRLSNPAVSEGTADRYAAKIRTVAALHNADPFTFVSIVSHESAWNPNIVGRGVDVGLCQININNFAECRAGHATDACKVRIELLKAPLYNLQVCGEIITVQRKFCRKYKVSRHAWFAEWLAQFQGRSPKGTYCLWKKHPTRMRRIGSRPKYKAKAHRYTKKVIAYRKCLIREINRGVRPGNGKRFRCQPWYGKG